MTKRLSQTEFERRVKILHETFIVTSPYLSQRKKVNIKCTICNTEVAKPSQLVLYRKLKCRNCNKETLSKKLRELRLLPHEEYWKAVKNNEFLDSIELLGTYEEQKKKIRVRCKLCKGEWDAFPSNLLNSYGCRICQVEHHKFKRLTHEVFLSRLDPDLNIEIISKYKGTTKPITFRCKVCNRVQEKRWTISLLNGHGCLFCNMSRGEKKIVRILEENFLQFKPQYSFPNSKFRFDFAIFIEDALSYLIEYDGEQHTKRTKHYSSSLEENIVKDQQKNQLAKNSNTPLIRIDYTEYKQISWELIKDKLEAAKLALSTF